MNEKPILFSGPMVRAILEGRKTMTRRVMKPQPTYDPGAWKNYHPIGGNQDGAWVWSPRKDCFWFCWDDWSNFDPRIANDCPYGRPANFDGDRLWVRETWAADIPGCPNGLSYRADHLDPRGDGPANPIHWHPSIHMPRWASRLTLEITSVKVERVQDISEADAWSEGISEFSGGKIDALLALGGIVAANPKLSRRGFLKGLVGLGLMGVIGASGLSDFTTARGTFAALWDSINGKRPGCSWSDNPWVWVVKFKKIVGAQTERPLLGEGK